MSMDAAGIGGLNPLSLLNLLAKTKDAAAKAENLFTQDAASIPANSTDAAGAFLPVNQISGANGGLSFSSILALQSIGEQRDAAATADPDAAPADRTDAVQAFLDEAKKTPMERLREQIMEELGLTEDALAQMAPEERRAAEEQIRAMIEEKLKQGMGASNAAADEPSVGQFLVEVA